MDDRTGKRKRKLTEAGLEMMKRLQKRSTIVSNAKKRLASTSKMKTDLNKLQTENSNLNELQYEKGDIILYEQSKSEQNVPVMELKKISSTSNTSLSLNSQYDEGIVLVATEICSSPTDSILPDAEAEYQASTESESVPPEAELVPMTTAHLPHILTSNGGEVVIEILGDVDLSSSHSEVQLVLIEAEMPEENAADTAEVSNLEEPNFERPNEESRAEEPQLELANVETLHISNSVSTDVQSGSATDCCECEICDRVLVGPLSKFRRLRCHRKSDNILWCPYCPFGAELKADYNRHLAADHSLDPDLRQLQDIRCPDPECRFSCQTTTEMADHTFVCHPHRHKCDKCSTSFFNKVNLAYHQATAHSTDKAFCCNVCDFSTPFKYKLKIHLQSHQEKSNCGTCGALVTSASMKAHTETHDVLSNCDNCEFRCRLCVFRTRTPYAIKYHLRTVHQLSFEEVAKFVRNVEA